MRGNEKRSESLFSYVRLEERIPADHPLRAIRTLVDAALAPLNERFEALYSPLGRPSIAPETLLRATLLQAFFSVRSKRQLMEQIDYNLLFRWFVGLSLDEGVWHLTVFMHNRDRLLEANVARDFLASLLALPQVKRLLSSDHFPVDGTLIDAWASMKSFRPKDGSGKPPGPGRRSVDRRQIHGEERARAVADLEDFPLHSCGWHSRHRLPGRADGRLQVALRFGHSQAPAPAADISQRDGQSNGGVDRPPNHRCLPLE